MSDFTEIPQEDNLKETVVFEETETEVIDESNPETLIDALARCGLFSKETERIPNILAFDDNIFNEEYYRKKHGKAFPEAWYKVMAEVSKKKFEDLRNSARQLEMAAGKVITWEN